MTVVDGLAGTELPRRRFDAAGNGSLESAPEQKFWLARAGAPSNPAHQSPKLTPNETHQYIGCNTSSSRTSSLTALADVGTLVFMNQITMAVSAAGLLLLLAGCASTPPTPTQTSTPTTPAASPTASVDPNAPAGQCKDDDLQVTITEGDPGVGLIVSSIEFTNTGAASCELRGAPGVSVVTTGGTELGAPAHQEEPTDPPTVTVAAGGTVTATLTAVNIVPDGGPLAEACTVAIGDGYRVYPPHSFTPIVVPMKDTPACEGDTVWLTVTNVQQP